MLGELLDENEVLAGMIIDLGLIPVELCTPTLMSKINEEIYAKSESEYWTQQRADDIREFCDYFSIFTYIAPYFPFISSRFHLDVSCRSLVAAIRVFPLRLR